MSVRKLVSAALAMAVVVAALRFNYLIAMQTNPTIAFQSIGLGVFCLWTASRLQVGMCLIAGLALRLLAPAPLSYYAGALIAPLALSGFCGFCLLIYWVTSSEREQLFRVFLPAWIFIATGVMLAGLLRLATTWATHRYDLQIYAMDRAVWGNLGPFFGRFLVTHSWANYFEETVYSALPAVMILVFAFYTYRQRDLALDLLGLYLALGISGFLLYFVVPACGPIYAFGNAFPSSLPPIATAVLANSIFQIPPNAMPSLHFGNALMLYWNSKPWPGLRIFTLAFAILTVIATLGTGEHYVTDLVVAIPFVAALQSLFGTASHRTLAVVFSLVLVCIWFLVIIALPVDGTPRWLLWALTLGSIVCPMLLGRECQLAVRKPA